LDRDVLGDPVRDREDEEAPGDENTAGWSEEVVDGTALFDRVTPGACEVTWTPANGAPIVTRDVLVCAGETTPVDVRIDE
jgi:hypothetical protein